MPKIIDYPRASLKSALELANAVNDLGGSCSMEMAAERLGRKGGGAFQAQISAAVKYGLVEAKAQRLSIGQIFRDYKLAYSPEEGSQKLREALLSVPVFKEVATRFAGKELPVSHFEKLLIRELGVPNDWGSRVASYFIDGAKQSGLLGEGNRIIGDEATELKDAVADEQPEDVTTNTEHSAEREYSRTMEKDDQAPSHRNYVVKIMGPGLNSTIEVHEPEDLMIVAAMLKKVEKALRVEDSADE